MRGREESLTDRAEMEIYNYDVCRNILETTECYENTV